MKAIIFNNAGEPKDVLKYVDIAKPTPGPKEVLIKLLGSPIHPADIMFIQGKYRYKPEFPQTAGIEGAGIVEEKGIEVKIPKGSLVAFMYLKSWAEYIVVPEEELVILPPDYPMEKALQFCANPFTAWGLLEVSKAKAGDWLLLTAGNSTVSRIIIQLAKLRNINTVAAIRDMHQDTELKVLGATAVLNVDDNLPDQLNSLTEGKGVNVLLEAVGGKTGTMVLQSMASNGMIIIYGLLNNEPVQFYNSQFVSKNLTLKGFGIRGYLQSQTKHQREEMLSVLTNEIFKPTFQLPVERAYSLDQFKDALADNAQSNRKGKIIIKV
ncbi:MAG: zinc-dependent alcohol dehydrogenase family protein [Ignavibacteriaceae bacterium]